VALAAVSTTLLTPSVAFAQAPAANLPPVTLDLRDAPIRSALEQLFNSAKVDFSMDNNVQGFVTLKVTEVPFETALKLIMRSATIPLTYTRENNIYIVRPRAVTGAGTGAGGPGGFDAPPVLPDAGSGSRQGVYPDQINLTYADPADLAGLFGITIMPTFQRSGGQGGMGGMGGGMGGLGGGGMMGGGMMGGMGGGMMGGGMGGMGGGMGGMGGGMMGGGMGGMGGGMGMGGFGGGRAF
jgi:hypothetical protein